MKRRSFPLNESADSLYSVTTSNFVAHGRKNSPRQLRPPPRNSSPSSTSLAPARLARTMHAFFDLAFTVLHDRVLDFLAERSWDLHRLLMPMALSRHWRQLATKKVVQRFSQEPEVKMVQDKDAPHLYDVTTRMKPDAGYIRVRLVWG